MTLDLDFAHPKLNQKEWLDKLTISLVKNCGEILQKFIMEGAPAGPEANEEKFTKFILNVIQKMDTVLTVNLRKKVFLDCAIKLSSEKIEHLKDTYKKNKDFNLVRQILHEEIRKELEQKGIPKIYKDQILQNGWGLAGELKDGRIHIIHIPDDIETYFSTDDERAKRAAYCSSPIIKKIVTNENGLTFSSCYCNSMHIGSYINLWEEITGKKIQVDINETVLDGALTCSLSLTFD